MASRSPSPSAEETREELRTVLDAPVPEYGFDDNNEITNTCYTVYISVIIYSHMLSLNKSHGAQQLKTLLTRPLSFTKEASSLYEIVSFRYRYVQTVSKETRAEPRKRQVTRSPSPPAGETREEPRHHRIYCCSVSRILGQHLLAKSFNELFLRTLPCILEVGCSSWQASSRLAGKSARASAWPVSTLGIRRLRALTGQPLGG